MNTQSFPYFNQDLNIEKRVEDLLSHLTIDEKISLLTHHTGFSAKPIQRLKIPEFGMTDGPHGCGAHSSFKTRNVYFPSAICLAASWNPELAYQYGVALGEETRAVGRHALLAPGINIHRTPLCGRNFEYFTEDPLLNSKMVVPLVKGIQSLRIAACVKHFICNNTEVRRRFSNSVVDERALEEIYYPGFKAAVSEGGAWMIMGAYNRVNGPYVYENKHLLTEKLRDEWAFKGFVVSDWFATHSVRDPVACIKAGFTLEMPKDFVYGAEKVKTAFDNGEFSEEELNTVIKPYLRVLFNVGLFDNKNTLPKGSRNTKEHLDLAVRIIEEGSILFKNENNLLPLKLDSIKKICIKGPMADYKPFIKMTGGSSAVNPPFLVSPLKGLEEKLQNKVEFVKNPEDADVVILITGITQWFGGDSEGMDKHSLEMPKKRIHEIKKIAAKNPNVVVVLFSGGPISMVEWINNIPAVLGVWQPHQMAGTAIAKLLFGEANPSGKIPTTIPKKLSDSPAHKSNKTYPSFKYSYVDMVRHEVLYVKPEKSHKGHPIDIHYEEGIYVGYRHFDKNNIEPMFPFGHGLSYTTFEYSNLKLNKTEFSKGDNIIIKLDLKNIGKYDGADIVQIYASDVECSVDRPPKELIGFSKEFLRPDEKKTIEITINTDRLAFYDVTSHHWKLEPGKFTLLVGASSRDIKQEQEISVK